MLNVFDVIIIGGSFAGMSAAMALGRARRTVLIIDSGKRCNDMVTHAHNLIGHDGEPPAEIIARAREQVAAYSTTQFLQGKAVAASGSNGSFEVRTEDGRTFCARKLLLAKGVQDIPMPIDGFAACWGISILHCPYCHGYEVADEPLGIVGNGDAAFEYAKLINNWTGNLTLFTNGPCTIGGEQVQKLQQHRITIVEKEIAAFVHNNGQLVHVAFKDGSTHAVKAIFARGGVAQHTDLPVMLGCDVHTEGMFDKLIKVDDLQKTSVPGVYAAGDNATPMRSLAFAIATGNIAGVKMNHELIADVF